MALIHFETATKQELDAEMALRTFYSYVYSWCINAGNPEEICTKQAVLPAFRSLQGGTPVDNVKDHYLRACLTLQTMTALPVDNHPALATSANFWAPVQAYYACHGFGLATIAALRLQSPGDHRRFLSTMSTNVLPRFFPAPFSFFCEGDPLNRTIPVQFPGAGYASEDITATSNLQRPTENNSDLLVAKSLATTRRWWLEDLLTKQRAANKRPRRTRRNLTVDEKRTTARNLHHTSLLDVLYRMRVRSNYDDPEMFVYGRLGDNTAVEHYKNMLSLVRIVHALCREIIKKKVGIALMAEIQDAVPVST